MHQDPRPGTMRESHSGQRLDPAHACFFVTPQSMTCNRRSRWKAVLYSSTKARACSCSWFR